ncbi:cytochrome P450 [Gordonia sp. ABSL1-1]|uniref:cytochrome P450 n=1 Tax=Gordonia sp. ABSL1-1 TaxID=3053923 RepID=UPI0025741478|nr:cytochrome P450 [Gordonia sp. ABSL1-1]MDL9936134.1 cytochrome P450 [Gordonia sp. ABSL1-1]
MAPDLSASAPAFELRSGSSWADPFASYADLREHSPIHRVPTTSTSIATSGHGTDPGEYWVLTRHADVVAAANDPATFSSADGLTVLYGELDAIGMRDNPPMVMTDPPAHTRFRSLVARGFTPRQVIELEPLVREFVVDRLERIDAADEVNIVDELFKPLPSMVVAHYLGVPDTDRGQFDAWTEAIVGADPTGGAATIASGPGDDDATATAAAAATDLLGYFAQLIDHRRDHPGTDTVSHLVAAGLGDDPAGTLSILAFTFTMVAGGNDTTTGMLGGSVALLSECPDQRDRLLADTSMIGPAIEEFLRLTSPVQNLARTTTRDVEFDGPAGPVTIPAGRKVLLCYAAANRDPRVFGADADRLDVGRNPRNILTFSHGAHHCLGAAAARLQARVALTELLTRFPDFTVDVPGIRWAAGNYVRRPTHVGFRPEPGLR